MPSGYISHGGLSPREFSVGKNQHLQRRERNPSSHVTEMIKAGLTFPQTSSQALFIFSTYVRPPPTRPGLRSWSRLFLTTGLGLWLGAVMSRNMAQVQYWNTSLWILVKELSMIVTPHNILWEFFRPWMKTFQILEENELFVPSDDDDDDWNEKRSNVK